MVVGLRCSFQNPYHLTKSKRHCRGTFFSTLLNNDIFDFKSNVDIVIYDIPTLFVYSLHTVLNILIVVSCCGLVIIFVYDYFH